MKHSRRIALVLLGSVSALSLTACDDKPKDGDPIYENVDQCKTLGGTQCDERWYQAASEHVKTAPRYNNQESCLQQGHQNCTPVNTGVPGSGNIWLPAMVGFMAGKMISETRPVYLQGYNDPRNDREREDRRVMAGGYHGGTSTPVMVGNYWDSGGGASNSSSNSSTSRPSLSQGMNAGAARAGWTSSAPSPNGVATSQAGTVASRMPATVSRGASVSGSSGSTSSAVSTSSSARGGFGGSGAGMGSSGGG